ncbi:diguanylate cyclase [Candidatus Sumerlaeota bacterium]|nr:diguanylate cyclase [Candidatus Sumerlaeota bacterium]
MDKKTPPPENDDVQERKDPETLSHSLTAPTPALFDSARVRPVLLVFDHNKVHEWYMVVKKEVRIGRDPIAEIEAPDDTVSRFHSKIVFDNIDRPDEEPVCVLYDENSRNGTLLNGKRVDKPTTLRNGDRIFVGKTCLAYFLRSEIEISGDQKLRSMAMTDSVTGLLNRSYMAIQFQKEIDRAHRYGRPLTLMMIEVDGLSEIANNHGMRNANHVLDKFSKVLIQMIRSHDMAARHSTVQFAVILPETALGGAQVIAERLRKVMDSQAFDSRVGDRRITISLGLVESRGGASETVESLLEDAEAALAAARERGGNCVHPGS